MYFDVIATGKKIKELRRKAGLTQEQFAEKLGITRDHLAHIEIGRKAPSLDLVVIMAGQLEVGFNDIIMTMN